MNTLKTGVVIILLLGVSYGVYQIINAPDPSMIGEEEPLDQFGKTNGIAVGQNNGNKDPSHLQSSPSPQENTGAQNPIIDAPPMLQGSGGDSFGPPNLYASQRSDTANESALRQSNPYITADNNLSGGNSHRTESGQHISGSDFANEMGTPSNGLKPIPPRPENASNGNGSLYGGQSIESQTAPQLSFEQIMARVKSLESQNDFLTALEELSPYYRNDLSQPQRELLTQWLDFLAFKVIFSSEHHLFPPHVVAQGETLASLAAQWQVPIELIYNINRSQIPNPDYLAPGTPLKVVRGPFKAEVNVPNKELTMFLNDMYAVRFPIAIGSDAQLESGLFRVQDKSNNGAQYLAADGRTLPAGDPQNPFGKYWIDLGSKLSIHEKPSTLPNYDQRGCIQVNYVDAKDIYSILSRDSKIQIVR